MTATNAAALANHLSCWRCAPLARRRRTISDPTDAATATGNSSATAASSPSTSRPAVPGAPSGLATDGSTASGPGRTASPTVAIARISPSSQATSRQRAAGSRPSGNSRKQNSGISNSAGAETQLPTQPSTRPPRSEPGEATSAWVA